MYKINDKNQKQVERVIRKLLKTSSCIHLQEDYNEKTRKRTYLLYACNNPNNRMTPHGIGYADNSYTKKEQETAISYMISQLIRDITGDKFEFEWEDNQTLEKIVEMRKLPY
jgi:hypothetical protein